MKTDLINLKNGAKLLFNRQSEVNGISIKFTFLAGSLNDPMGKLGVAHFVEHALCDFSNAKFTRAEIESYARKFQYRNAYTSSRDIAFIIHTVEENFEEAIDFLTEAFKSIKFLPEDFAQEKKIIEDEIKMRMQINNRLAPHIINTKIINDESFNNLVDSPAGTITTFSRIKLDDLKVFKEKYISSNNLTISISGNISKAKAVKIIKKYVGERLAPSGVNGYDKRELELYEPKVHFKKAVESGKSKIILLYDLKKVPFNFKESKESIVARILSSILSEKVFEFFRVKNKLCYGCNNYVYVDLGHLFNNVTVACQDDNLDDVISLFGEFIKECEGNLPKELFEKHKKKVVDAFNFDFLSITDLSEIIEVVYHDYREMYDDKYLQKNHDRLAKVTYDDVNEMYQRLFTTKPYIILIADEKYKNFGYKRIIYDKE